MERKKRALLLAAAVLLCVVLGCAALLFWTGRKEDPGDEWISLPTAGITAVQFPQQVNGQDCKLLCFQQGESRIYQLEPQGASGLAADQQAAAKLVTILETLKAYEQLEAKDWQPNPEDPWLKLELSDGSVCTLVFGGQTPVSGRSYLQIRETGAVYVVRTDINQLGSQPALSLRQPQVLGDQLRADSQVLLERLSIQTPENQLVIRPQTAQEQAQTGWDAPAYYRLEAPVAVQCQDGRVDADLLTPLAALESAARVVEDFPKALEEYGLAGAGQGEIRLTTETGECIIRLGNTDGSETYLMREGLPAVLAVPTSQLAFLQTSWQDLIHTSIWMREIGKVQAVTIQTPDGSQWRLHLTHEADGTLQGGDLEGKPLDAETVQELYMAVLSVHLDGWLGEEFTEGETASSERYQISLERLDGEEETAIFSPVDARRYAVTREGLPEGFYTGVSTLETLVKTFSQVMENPAG